MGQLTIYLDDDVEKSMKAWAKAMKLSISKWIADAIREKLMHEWPANVRELAGSWEDFRLWKRYVKRKSETLLAKCCDAGEGHKHLDQLFRGEVMSRRRYRRARQAQSASRALSSGSNSQLSRAR